MFENLNARSIYEVPLMIHEEGMDERVCRLLGIPAPEADLTEWRGMVGAAADPERDVRIAIVGKYVELPDAYLSIVEALTHGGIAHHAKVRVEWVAAESVTPENAAEKLAGSAAWCQALGQRGLEARLPCSMPASNGAVFGHLFKYGRWPWWNMPATCSA